MTRSPVSSRMPTHSPSRPSMWRARSPGRTRSIARRLVTTGFIRRNSPQPGRALARVARLLIVCWCLSATICVRGQLRILRGMACVASGHGASQAALLGAPRRPSKRSTASMWSSLGALLPARHRFQVARCTPAAACKSATGTPPALARASKSRMAAIDRPDFRMGAILREFCLISSAIIRHA
jgi:hypothetical protein